MNSLILIYQSADPYQEAEIYPFEYSSLQDAIRDVKNLSESADKSLGAGWEKFTFCGQDFYNSGSWEILTLRDWFFKNKIN